MVVEIFFYEVCGLLLFKEITDFFLLHLSKIRIFTMIFFTDFRLCWLLHFVFNLCCVSICVVLGYSHRVDLFGCMFCDIVLYQYDVSL